FFMPFYISFVCLLPPRSAPAFFRFNSRNCIYVPVFLFVQWLELEVHSSEVMQLGKDSPHHYCIQQFQTSSSTSGEHIAAFSTVIDLCYLRTLNEIGCSASESLQDKSFRSSS
ncbi:hypothetical protein Tcan_01057, partial [Toxocara canis]